MRGTAPRPNALVVAMALLVALSAVSGVAAAGIDTHDAPASTVTTAQTGVTVSLSPDPVQVSAGGTTNVSVVVSGVTDGVGTADFNVSVSDTSIATIEGVTIEASGTSLSSVDVANDGSSAAVSYVSGNTGDTGDVTIATVTVATHTAGWTALSLSVDAMADESNGQLQVSNVQSTLIQVSNGSNTVGNSVSLTPDPATTASGATRNVSVVVGDVSNGVGTAEFSVSVADTSVATIQAVTVEARNTALSSVSVASDGSSASADFVSGDTDDTGNVTIATVTVEGQSVGSTSLSVSVSTLADEDNNRMLVGATSGTTVQVTGGPTTPIGNAANPPQDPDGDGVYEDVNGDGFVDLIDVSVLYNNRQSAAVTTNGQFFDFDNSGGFDLIDVSVFYGDVTAP